MIYWLAFATALPVATWVSAWLTRGIGGIGYDTAVMLWLIAMFGAFFFGLLGYHDHHTPFFGVFSAAALPILTRLRVAARSSSSLGPGDDEQTWALAFWLGAALTAAATTVAGIWLSLSSSTSRLSDIYPRSTALLFANFVSAGLTALMACRAASLRRQRA